MDWLSWLSKTSLDPCLVYDYALTFAHNELDQEDIPFFNHEFLQSMGISVAKHRLEILKLAGKDQKFRSSSSKMKKQQQSSKQSFLWLVKKVKTNLGKHIRAWVRREDSAGSLAIVSARNCSLRWKAAMLKRNKSVVAASNGHGRLMVLTNWGNSSVSSSPFKEHRGGDVKTAAGDGECWSPTLEDIKWDSMFRNLKPT